jgi:hypothetical protein
MTDSVKCGDKLTITASPKLMLDLSDALEQWLIKLSEQGDIETDRECLSMSQDIIGILLANSKRGF